MAEVEVNQTVRVESDDPRLHTFAQHCAFSVGSPFHLYDHEDAAEPRDPRHDTQVQTAPAPFDRTHRDDVDRVQYELMVQLAGLVDDHCLQVLVEHDDVAVDDVAVDELRSWVLDACVGVGLDRRANTDLRVYHDVELDAFLPRWWDGYSSHVELGWSRVDLAPMARGGSLAAGTYVVVGQEHVVGLTSAASLYYASHLLEREEYLSARCDLAYAPRLGFHPGAVQIARVGFAGEGEWREAVRALAPRG